MKLLSPLFALLASTSALNLSTIYQFPNGTWLENIAHMQNGSLLVTMIRKAEVHIVNPSTATSNTTSSLLASFPAHNSVLGITEMQRNVFAVAVGNVTETNSPVEGTFAIYSINLTTTTDAEDCENNAASTRDVVVKHIADLPSQGLLNGIAFHPPSTLYLADSWLGQIVKLNSRTGKVESVINHPTLEANFSSPSLPLGVNGLRVHHDYLYFSNTVQNLLGRIDLSASDSTDVDVQIVKQGEEISQPDDFAVLNDGSVLLARPLADTLQHIGLDGRVEEIARGGEVSGGTSVVKGKKGLWYVSTSGLVGGAPEEGGRVVRVEV